MGGVEPPVLGFRTAEYAFRRFAEARGVGGIVENPGHEGTQDSEFV